MKSSQKFLLSSTEKFSSRRTGRVTLRRFEWSLQGVVVPTENFKTS